VQGWGYFREIRNPVWRLLQLAVLGEGPPRQLLCVVNSTQIYGNHATGPVNCRSRRQAAEQTKKPESCNCWVSSYESIQQPFPVLVYIIKYELRYKDHALLIEQWCKRMEYKLTQTRCRTYRNSRTIYACAVQCSCPDKARLLGVTSVNG